MNTVLLIAMFFCARWTESLASQDRDLPVKESARSGIRQIDFADQSYTIPERDSDRDPTFRVLSSTSGTVVRLTNGKYQADNPIGRDWVSVTLHSVSYGDVTSDGREEAIVALRVHTAGTQSWGLLFVYQWTGTKLGLLEAFWTGDRANEGLYKAYVDRGHLVVEIFDPKASVGDCCSSRVFKVRHRWSGSSFVKIDRQTAAVQR